MKKVILALLLLPLVGLAQPYPLPRSYIDSRVLTATNGEFSAAKAIVDSTFAIPYPMLDSWMIAGVGAGGNKPWLGISNWMFYTTNGGLNISPGVNSIVIYNDGMQSLTRTNGGHLYPHGTNITCNLTNACKVAHSMGFMAGQYMQPGTATSAGYLPNNLTNLAIDVADAFYAGIDFIRFDQGYNITSSTDCGDGRTIAQSNKMRFLNDLYILRQELNKYPKPISIISSGWNEDNVTGLLITNNTPTDFFLKGIKLVNVMGVGQDIAGESGTNMWWTNILRRFRVASSLTPYCDKNHRLFAMDTWAVSTNETVPFDMSCHDLIMQVTLGCLPHLIYPYGYGEANGRANYATNLWIYAASQDPLGTLGYCWSTNATGGHAEVWGRELTGGRQFVTLFNTSTNTVDTNTIKFISCGWPSNTMATVVDNKAGTIWATPVTDAFTVVIPPCGVSNYTLIRLNTF